MAENVATVSEVCRYWSGAPGVNRISPNGRFKLSMSDALRVSLLCRGQICDVGCGTGRLARWFDPSRYIGLDINEEAVRLATVELPEHKFRVIKWGDQLPAADTYLFWTVLLHVPDPDFERMLKTIPGAPGRRVLVVETMDPQYRSTKFNNQRTPEQYICAFGTLGWGVVKHERIPIPAAPWFKDWLELEWRDAPTSPQTV